MTKFTCPTQDKDEAEANSKPVRKTISASELAQACIDDNSDDILGALAAYEQERRPRTSRVQLQARTQFLNNKKTPAPPPLSREWIFSWDAATGRDYAGG